METDPYGSLTTSPITVGLIMNQPLWFSWVVALSLLLLAAFIFLAFKRIDSNTAELSVPDRGDESTGGRNGPPAVAARRTRLALFLLGFVVFLSGFALLINSALRQLPVPSWLRFVYPLTIIVTVSLVGTVIWELVIRPSSQAKSATNSGLWIGIGKIVSFLLFPVVAPLGELLERWSARASSSPGGERDEREESELESSFLEEDEAQLGDYLAEFRAKDVEEVMTSRMDITAIPATATLQEAVNIIRESGHSRLPLYRDHLDHIEGMIYAKDLLPLLTDGKPESCPDWSAIARKPLLVTTEQSIAELLRAFKVGTAHVALVVDEYGGTEGLVALEDVLEELVGEIRDEFDHHEPVLVERIDDTRIRFDARVDLDDFKSMVALYLDTEVADAIDTEDFEFESLGGLIQHITQSSPDSGTEVRALNLVFMVEDVDQHRIGHVVVSLDERMKGKDGTVAE